VIDINLEASIGWSLNINKIANDLSNEDFILITGESKTDQTSFIARLDKETLVTDWVLQLGVKELNDFS